MGIITPWRSLLRPAQDKLCGWDWKKTVPRQLGINFMVRVGPVHYNTVEEIERFGEALLRIAALRDDE